MYRQCKQRCHACLIGTTVGAGILALPFTTQDSGFIPSSASLFGTYIFSIVTGLLLAEANVNLMCELGKVRRSLNMPRQTCRGACLNKSLRKPSIAQGGVSITSISRTTLGTAGERVTTVIYITLHYALLVACKATAACWCPDAASLFCVTPVLFNLAPWGACALPTALS